MSAAQPAHTNYRVTTTASLVIFQERSFTRGGDFTLKETWGIGGGGRSAADASASINFMANLSPFLVSHLMTPKDIAIKRGEDLSG